jgi:hypothetical protein
MGNVLQVQGLKVIFQLARVEQIGSQLRIIAGAISLDLLDNELGVSFHKELPNPSDKVVLNPKSRASYPEDRVPLHRNSKSRQEAGRASMRCHISCSFGPHLSTEVGSGAVTCPTAPDLTSLLRFYDTFTGAATGAARCGSFVGDGFGLLVTSYG